eukprot:366007-Chlamydomonas_euryale.AAC.8
MPWAGAELGTQTGAWAPCRSDAELGKLRKARQLQWAAGLPGLLVPAPHAEAPPPRPFLQHAHQEVECLDSPWSSSKGKALQPGRGERSVAREL